MSLYNISNITAANNIYGQAVAVNSVTGGILGISILAIVSIITFSIQVSQSQDILSGLSTAGWISAVTATILLPLDLIAFYHYQIAVLLAGATVLAAMLLKSRIN